MSKTKVDGGGQRHNTGKLQWHLLPLELIEETIRVMMFGATKYEKFNWKRGFDYSSVLDCLQRHIEAFKKGEDIDKESNCHHLAHAVCNLVFLYYFNKRKAYRKHDDRKDIYG